MIGLDRFMEWDLAVVSLKSYINVIQVDVSCVVLLNV